MSFLETIRRAKAFLQEQGRVSLRALKREFDLDEDACDELVEELVDVQRVARYEGDRSKKLRSGAASDYGDRQAGSRQRERLAAGPPREQDVRETQ
jgi:hypothetical protein